MTRFLTVAAIWLTPSLLIGAWILADRWLARRAADKPPTPPRVPQPRRVISTPEWERLKALQEQAREEIEETRAVIAWAERHVTADMGSIFEAGYERQAKRLAAELEDDAAVDAWLGRSS